MLRFLYLTLVRFHPRQFRERFGPEMIWIFEQSPKENAAALVGDAWVSLIRQWLIRDHEVPSPESPRTAIGGAVPVFYLAKDEIPERSTLGFGALCSVALFTAAVFAINHGTTRNVGRSLSPQDAVARLQWLPDARPVHSAKEFPIVLDAAQRRALGLPDTAPQSLWQRIRKVFQGDGPAVSSIRSVAPPVRSVLVAGSGAAPPGASQKQDPPAAVLPRSSVSDAIAKVRADVSGSRPQDDLALDGNSHAPAALLGVEPNLGIVSAPECPADPVATEASHILSYLDRDGNGRISLAEAAMPRASGFTDLLQSSDRNRDHVVTRQELEAELRRRADRDHDGHVTCAEMQQAQRSGAVGPYPPDTRFDAGRSR